MKPQEVVGPEDPTLRRAEEAWEESHSKYELNDHSTYPGWESSKGRDLTGKPLKFENGYRWEMDVDGRHRIVDDENRGGEWTGYEFPSVSPNGRFICVTEYWTGTFPVETLIKMKVIPCRNRK